jgi:excisionase family DNA binding protein
MISRNDEIVKLRKDGLTYAEIGRRFGITKERVRQILTPKPPKPALHSKFMLTVGDVAILLSIHINTVRRWADEGMLKAYRIGTRHDRRFRREDIDAFLEEGGGAASNLE